MFQLRRRGPVGYEDLLRDLESIEKALLGENSALAMDLMVVDAKLRERFYWMERQMAGTGESKAMPPPEGVAETMTMEDLRALIPNDLPPFPTIDMVDQNRERKRKLETVGMAAVLALITAAGVFGLASLLQVALTWVL